MILRRIKAHIEKENWFAVGIDFFIVVIGVFIGLQVANWNEWRTERDTEREILLNIYGDLVESSAAQARDVRFLEQQISDQSLVLRSLDACKVEPEDAAIFERGIATLGWMNAPRHNSRTFQELTAAGRYDLISNDALARDLTELQSVVEWRGGVYDYVTNVIAHNREKIDQHVRYRIDRTIENPFVPNHPGSVDYDIETLCGIEGVANAISAIQYETQDRADAYRGILDYYEAILPKIETELQSRWNTDLKEETIP